MQARKKNTDAAPVIDTHTGNGALETGGAPTPLTPRHEAFAQAISLGEDPVKSCQRIFRCTAATARAKSISLWEDPAISARITTLQQQASHIAHQAHFDKAQLIAFLVETIQTPVSSVDQHHRQCQEWTRDELTTSGRRTQSTSGQKTQTPISKTSKKSKAISKTKGIATSEDVTSRAGESTTETAATPILLRSKTKLPSKLDAAKLLATLCGWHAPSKLENNVHVSISPVVDEALSSLLK